MDPLITSILGPEVVPKIRAPNSTPDRLNKNGQGSDFIGLVE